MRNISDIIENFLRTEIDLSHDGIIEVQRSSLAEKFQCVPSQINYVISTRFSFEKGFLVESKRGGGGYIRIRKLEFGSKRSFYESLIAAIGDQVPQSTAMDILDRLKETDFITIYEYDLLKSVVSREVLSLPLPLRDEIRANILRAVIRMIFSKK